MPQEDWVEGTKPLPGPDASEQQYLLELAFGEGYLEKRQMKVAHLYFHYEDEEEEYEILDKASKQKVKKIRLKKVFKESLWMVDNWYVRKQGYRVVAWRPVELSGL